jgi:predicted nucleic-acid-binding Zn-ribbon protein
MKLICPKCRNTDIQLEETYIYKGEIQIDIQFIIDKSLLSYKFKDHFYCLKCDFHTNDINDFSVEVT